MRFAAMSAVATLAAAAVAASAADFLPVGEKAPLPTVKEVVNARTYSAGDLDGKVVLYDIFRTW
ncbi:MAG TPA: hypothetical protein VFS92_00575 [Planctomycetota bacterium]|nr:hypothetical protein [Planctomycetota bacterium]